MAGLLSEQDVLRRLISEGRPAPDQPPTFLTLHKIKVCEAVFQHRAVNERISNVHAQRLAEVLKRDREADLDPILIFWGGNAWYCVDGHHRIEAYRVAGRYDWHVPVEVFNGTLDEAIAKALECNSKDKLPTTTRERSDGAWRLVISTTLTVAQIAHAAGGIGQRTVKSMRAAMKKLQQSHPDQPLDQLNWLTASKLAKGVEGQAEIGSDDWVQKKAQDLANSITKHLGDRIVKSPEITAAALEICSPTFYAALVDYLQNVHEDDMGDDE